MPRLALLIICVLTACDLAGEVKIYGVDTDPCEFDPDQEDLECGEPTAAAWYPDQDFDGFGDDSSRPISSPSQPPGSWRTVKGDCDDANSAVNPRANEVCDGVDNDCDDRIDNVVTDDCNPSDSPGDTDYSADSVLETDPPLETDVVHDTDSPPPDTDPLDTDPVIPDTSDSGDSADFSGDTYVPETDPPLETDVVHDTDSPPPDTDPLDTYRNYYRDMDGDGQGAGAPVYATAPPIGYVENNNDCDDANPDIYRGADEVCNGYDDDCDGYIDADALDAFLVYDDQDGDGQGSEDDDGRLTCSLEMGDSLVGTDCDDSDPLVLAGGVSLDTCGDGLDQNCDRNPDNNPGGALNWYTDYDSDGYGGSTGSTTTSCGLPDFPDTARVLGDCNDGNPGVNPGAQEVCDDLGLDEDCDGQADDDDSSVDPQSLRVFYLDVDGDGYGGPTTELACDAIGSLYSDTADCDDDSVDYSPDAYEWDDAADWNCDGSPWRESISTTATGQTVQWVESWRGLGGDVPSLLNWSSTGPQPINFGFDVLSAGASLPPGQTPWMIVGAPSTGAGHNCARRTYSAVPSGDWGIGVVHQFTNPGLSEPVIRWDGQVISSGHRHAQGQSTVFQAYGPVTGDGGPHVLEICEALNSSGLQVAIVGTYPVDLVP